MEEDKNEEVTDDQIIPDNEFNNQKLIISPEVQSHFNNIEKNKRAY